MAEKQISAYVSEATGQRLERYARAHGLKKSFLVEEALLHHMNALDELPADILIPPRIVVTAESFAEVAKLVKHPRQPTQAMQDLMVGKPVDADP